MYSFCEWNIIGYVGQWLRLVKHRTDEDQPLSSANLVLMPYLLYLLTNKLSFLLTADCQLTISFFFEFIYLLYWYRTLTSLTEILFFRYRVNKTSHSTITFWRISHKHSFMLLSSVACIKVLQHELLLSQILGLFNFLEPNPLANVTANSIIWYLLLSLSIEIKSGLCASMTWSVWTEKSNNILCLSCFYVLTDIHTFSLLHWKQIYGILPNGFS